MTQRWVLARAGILNVYQYGDEVLHFAGGRLLLRGVNGSGKSTAMNMLLPFLIDGDTGRIDAAGEQSGVLKSWMLAGREDPQPIGYLWLELARGGERLCFGCGIKANRASDTVNTWWWVTSRRPGIDLALVDDQRPLSMEALRAALGGDPVFRHDQRAGYRAEIRDRLYGGANLDQHIRLLHIVRNPRVGDRVDVDLPAHLHDALPQLSEAALLDAAQPLDELEEHRRNVAELTRTAATLDALVGVYAMYARSELHRRATYATELAGGADRARRTAAQAERRAATAAQTTAEARQHVAALVADEERLRTELMSLKDAPAYAAGRDLEDLRARVSNLAASVTRADQQLAGRRREQEQAAAEARQATAAARADHGSLASQLWDLTDCVVGVGLALGPPDLPALGIEPLDLGEELYQPVGPLGGGPVRERIEQLKAAVTHRRGDLDEVRRELRRVDVAESQLERATHALRAGQGDADAKREAVGERRRQLDQARAVWLESVHDWLADLDAHRAAAGLAPAARPGLEGDVAGRHRELITDLNRMATATAEQHGNALATLRARLAEQRDAAEQASAIVADLESVCLPPPPTLSWQRTARGVVLGEVVDFHDDVDSEQRAGIEAALEASGLLAAEVTADGALASADGELLVFPGPPTREPLARVLRLTEDLDRPVDPEVVERLLAGISTAASDVDHLGEGRHEAVVTVTGRFRVGPLRGRYRKDRAEHIGGSARRASLERQRAEARAQLDSAVAALTMTGSAIADTEVRHAAARQLRDRVPDTGAVVRALAGVESAVEDARVAEDRLVELRATVVAADEAHAEAVDKCRMVAASLELPPSTEGLAAVEQGLSVVGLVAHQVGANLTLCERSVAAWGGAARRWREAAAAFVQAGATLAEARDQHQPAAVRLTTLEDAVGVAYDEILRAVSACETDLASVTERLGEAREEQVAAATATATARAEAEEQRRSAAEAEKRCVADLPRLRAALAVPGLTEAATDDVGVLRQPVEETPAGVRSLAALIGAHVPSPGRSDIRTDGVRQSLRQRRDALGAGWDAEDRQPDETLPMSVEVTGPEGRMPLVRAAALVAARLGELSALLSAEQDNALRNLLQGMVAKEVADKLRAAGDLIERMNSRLGTITTAHGIGISLRWRRRDALPADLDAMVDLLAKPPDLRTADQEDQLRVALSARLDDARCEEPEASYRDLVGRVLDYRSWYEITVLVHRPGRSPEKLARRTALSEGEKKIVSYLPLFAAVAASCDSLGEIAPDAPRFVLLDDAFAKVSEDNHPKLFGLLVELDLDFVATSERLWGTHPSVPELAITEVIRDAGLGVIVMEHSRWTSSEGLVRN